MVIIIGLRGRLLHRFDHLRLDEFSTFLLLPIIPSPSEERLKLPKYRESKVCGRPRLC